MEKISFFINDKEYKINVIKTKNKNMYLKIKDGEIILSSPSFRNRRMIETFVCKHLEKLENIAKKQKENKLICLENNFIIFRGVKTNINISYNCKKNNIKIINKNLFLEVKKNDLKEIEKLIKLFLKEETHKYISKKINYFEKQMNLNEHDFIIVYKKSSWGTNFCGRNKISFSSRLSHFKEEVTDYLIVHELSHSLFPNHSKNFWNNVKKYKKNFKELSNELKI